MTWRHYLLTSFTFTILLAGMKAILCCVDGHFVLAAYLIILAAILDGMDGTLARRVGGATDFGARLDSYVDTVCFGVAPAVLLYCTLVKTGLPASVATAVAFITAATGVLRFTRGCEIDEGEGKHVFRGLPIPIPAVWITLLILATQTGALGLAPTGLAYRVVLVFMCVSAVVLVSLELSSVRYAKPRGWQVVTSLAILVVLGLVARSVTFGVIAAGSLALQVYVISGLVQHRASTLAAVKDGAALSVEN